MCDTVEQLEHGFNSPSLFHVKRFSISSLWTLYKHSVHQNDVHRGRENGLTSVAGGWGCQEKNRESSVDVRQQQGSNLRGGTPIDFKSIALTTRPYWQLLQSVAIILIIILTFLIYNCIFLAFFCFGLCTLEKRILVNFGVSFGHRILSLNLT